MLIELIADRLRRERRGTFEYGDLSEIIHKTRSGARSFKHSLGEIYFRMTEYNRIPRTDHPRLNSLVYNQKHEQPGIPRQQDPNEIWRVLERHGPRYLGRLGILLGFNRHIDEDDERSNGNTTPDDPGVKRGGVRSKAIWEARHSPLVEEIACLLKDDWQQCDCRPWKPDIVRRRGIDGCSLLIEVKPESDQHNVITAIGQVLAYRSRLSRCITVISVPRTNRISKHLSAVLKSHAIRVLDLDGDLSRQLRTICK